MNYQKSFIQKSSTTHSITIRQDLSLQVIQPHVTFLQLPSVGIPFYGHWKQPEVETAAQGTQQETAQLSAHSVHQPQNISKTLVI